MIYNLFVIIIILDVAAQIKSVVSVIPCLILFNIMFVLYSAQQYIYFFLDN